MGSLCDVWFVEHHSRDRHKLNNMLKRLVTQILVRCEPAQTLAQNSLNSPKLTITLWLEGTIAICVHFHRFEIHIINVISSFDFFKTFCYTAAAYVHGQLFYEFE